MFEISTVDYLCGDHPLAVVIGHWSAVHDICLSNFYHWHFTLIFKGFHSSYCCNFLVYYFITVLISHLSLNRDCFFVVKRFFFYNQWSLHNVQLVIASTQCCFSLTYLLWPPLGVFALHSLFLFSDPPPPHSPSPNWLRPFLSQIM